MLESLIQKECEVTSDTIRCFYVVVHRGENSQHNPFYQGKRIFEEEVILLILSGWNLAVLVGRREGGC